MALDAMAQAEKHVAEVCEQAGLDSMAEVFRFVMDRDEISAAVWQALTPADVTSFYDGIVAEAVDQIESILMDREES